MEPVEPTRLTLREPRVQDRRAAKLGASMDHPMTHTQHARPAIFGPQPHSESINRLTSIAYRDILVRHAFTVFTFS